MYAKPNCPTLLKIFLVLIIVIELIAIGFLVAKKAGAFEGESASDREASRVVEPAVEPEAEDSAGTEKPVAAGAEPVTITVSFAGDCILGTDADHENGRSFNRRWEEEGDATYFLRNVADLFGADDLTVVNLAGVLTDGGERADKEFAFRGSPEYAKILSSGSVEAASLANNNSHDYGNESYDDTIAALDAEGVAAFGLDRIEYRDIKGVKVALIGVNALDDTADYVATMTNDIATARSEKAQLVLVYFCWGEEYDYDPSTDQVAAGHAAIDAGADLVVGASSHVIQGWELYQGRYIVYSLGNFCYGGNTNPSDKDCLIFQQTFTVTDGEVLKDENANFIACSVSSDEAVNNYQPTPAEGDEKARIDAKVQEAAERVAQITAA